MKPLPDILTSASFWAQIATLWAAAGAWFTYVAAVISSRQQTYDALTNLIEGLEAELALVSEWAAGDKGNPGYVDKTRAELALKHTDWFNPSRAIFKFDTPTITNLTNSAYTKSLTPIVRPFVMLNHSIRRVFENIDRYEAFVYGDAAMFQAVLPKFAPDPKSGSSKPSRVIVTPHPATLDLSEAERTYVNHVFMMNETIHQKLIGGMDSPDENCLYKAFRTAKAALADFRKDLKREPLPKWFVAMHVMAGALALVGLWELVRWFELWPLINRRW